MGVGSGGQMAMGRDGKLDMTELRGLRETSALAHFADLARVNIASVMIGSSTLMFLLTSRYNKGSLSRSDR